MLSDSNRDVKMVKEQTGHTGEVMLLHRWISHDTKKEVSYILATPALCNEVFDESEKMALK